MDGKQKEMLSLRQAVKADPENRTAYQIKRSQAFFAREFRGVIRAVRLRKILKVYDPEAAAMRAPDHLRRALCVLSDSGPKDFVAPGERL